MNDLISKSSEYGSWLIHLKTEIRAAQIRAAVSVNVEMLE